MHGEPIGGKPIGNKVMVGPLGVNVARYCLM